MAVAPIPNLITLNAERNNIKDLKFLNVEEGWKNLRILNLGYNKIA
jgi:Leucine-rich repeat (LRR) protein